MKARRHNFRVQPLLGGAISGAPEAYRYLPESVRKFPEAGELAAMMGEARYVGVEWEYCRLSQETRRARPRWRVCEVIADRAERLV